jgi:methyl-accepting chemotaxis protein
MNPFAKLSMRSSMRLFSAVAMLAMLGIGVMAALQSRHNESLSAHLLDELKLARAAGSLDMAHDALRADVLSASLAGMAADDGRHKVVLADLQRHATDMNQAAAVMHAHAQGQTAQALAEALPELQTYIASASKTVKDALQGHAEADRMAAFDKDFKHMEERLAKLSALVEEEAVAIGAEKAAHFARGRWLLGVSVAVAGLLLAGMASLFARATMRRLGAEPAALGAMVERIANGELTHHLPGQVDPHSVAGGMLRMCATLGTAVRQIRSDADGVAVASEQIASSSDDLSTRTGQQASALQQTAATMEQLGGTVQQNAHSATQANTLAQRASQVAEHGGEVVSQVVHTMKDIQVASKRIADITGVIDSIAFQTNILALNAAVEAARAGEQGRGFAVVASEVRMLAQRSAEAAREIKSLITASVERVAQGSALADNAGTTMADVVVAIQRVNDIVSEISAASAEQSAGVAQVGQAMSKMDRATQENASLVDHSASAAQTLRQQAHSLVQAVSVFKLQQV